MTDNPGTPDTPGNASERKENLIDAVVGSAPAEPASADVAPTDNAPTSTDSADHENPKKTKKKKSEPTTFGGKLWHAWIKPIGSVFIIVAVVRSVIIDWNDVPSGSMEPTIVVGDRILVNKMAYALQFPLSGPKIGVPFTALQWDNPLDGLPSWQWGKPVRGDIVTFWNPVTGVRMVKRIVAQPGDTLELRGGIMTITPADGSPNTATYNDTTPFPPNRTIVGKDEAGNEVNKPTQDAEETLLGETRNIQHLRDRWIDNWGVARLPNGSEIYVIDDVAAVNSENQALFVKRNVTEQGIVHQVQGQGISTAQLQQRNGGELQLFVIRAGAPYLDGQAVDYNTFAAAYLKPIADGGPIDFAGTAIGVQGHVWTMDGEPASAEDIQLFLIETNFSVVRRDQTQAPTTQAQEKLLQSFRLLRSLMTSSFGPVVLDDDDYYMIGDNRNNSTDSRYFGPVQRSEITGQAVAIPASFHGRIRDLDPHWSRWFHGLD